MITGVQEWTAKKFLSELEKFSRLVHIDERQNYAPFHVESEDKVFYFSRDRRNVSVLSINFVELSEEVDLKIHPGENPTLWRLGNPSLLLHKVSSNNDFRFYGLTGSLEINTCNFSKANVSFSGAPGGDSRVKIITSDFKSLTLPAIKNIPFEVYGAKINQELNFDNTFQPSEIFIFDLNVNSKPYYTYRKLRLAAESSKDKIQSISLYNQELHAFVNNDRWYKRLIKNDWWTFKLSWISNNHGQSFVQPIYLAYVFNLTLLSFVLGCSSLFNFNLFVIAFNINPLTSYVSDNTEAIIVALDGLRRGLMAVFIYLTIQSLRKFNYKFPS